MCKALHEASQWLDKMENRPEQCVIVARDSYINCPKELILGRLLGKMDYGDGRTIQDPNYMIFSQRNCNYPQLKYAQWFLTQYRRWGMVTGTPDYTGIAKKVMRPDIYEEAMKEIGYAHGGVDDKPESFFDGTTFEKLHSSLAEPADKAPYRLVPERAVLGNCSTAGHQAAPAPAVPPLSESPEPAMLLHSK